MLKDLHATLGWALIVLNGLAGLWALAAHWVVGLRGRPLLGFTIVAQVVVVVQVILGVLYLNRSGTEVSGLHQAYGFMALIAVGIIYSYRQQIEKWTYLLYGFGGLFIMGLGLRAVLL